MTNPLEQLLHDPDGYLGIALPPGRFVYDSESGVPTELLLWISDATPEPGLWRSLQALHHRTGLWPLILGGTSYAPHGPWDGEELMPSLIKSRPGDHDVENLLARWWSERVVDPEEDEDDEDADVEPFTDRWPGLAPGGHRREDPDANAASLADYLLTARALTLPRIGLSASALSADTLADLAWVGPLNYENDTAQFSAVLRSWEDRFGVRVVGMGHADLYVSVAAPPTDMGQALRVAAEHAAFCPDNVFQSGTGTLARYAASLLGREAWSFWWD